MLIHLKLKLITYYTSFLCIQQLNNIFQIINSLSTISNSIFNSNFGFKASPKFTFHASYTTNSATLLNAKVVPLYSGRAAFVDARELYNTADEEFKKGLKELRYWCTPSGIQNLLSKRWMRQCITLFISTFILGLPLSISKSVIFPNQTLQLGDYSC